MSDEDLEYGFTRFNSQTLPTFCQFETGTACNVHPSCYMCPHDKMKRRGSAKWSTLIEIVEDILPHASACCPFLMQEPLLEPRLINILNDIRHTTPTTEITIYTNMALMTEEMAKAILETRAVARVAMSFYGPTEELYNKWQPGLDWETTKENMKRFIRMRDEMGIGKPKIDLHYLAVKELLYWWPELSAEWLPLVDRICVVPFDTFHGDVPDEGLPGYFKEYLDLPEKRAPCKRLWSVLTILFNGDVVPCCLDYQDSMPMGNIHKENVRDIWRGDKLNELRRLHIEKRFDEIPLCKDCNVWKYPLNVPSDKQWMERWI